LADPEGLKGRSHWPVTSRICGEAPADAGAGPLPDTSCTTTDIVTATKIRITRIGTVVLPFDEFTMV
jgi:hypothetical protein